MDTLPLNGRVLFLCDDPDKLKVQLAGTQLTLAQAGVLRDGVSTDEITPSAAMTFFDERIAHHLYTGFRGGMRANAIPAGSIDRSNFTVTVAGERYGKGSSREHSPAAEIYAGIKLVIARSFERIYRQNADNLGLLTSTDLGLVDRILRGETIELEEVLRDRDATSAAILRSGGLLRHGRRAVFFTPHAPGTNEPARPMTLTEKILQRHWVAADGLPAALQTGQGAFVRADWRFIHDPYTGMAAHRLEADGEQVTALRDPDSILAFADHFSYVPQSPAHLRAGSVGNVIVLHKSHEDFAARYGIRSHGYQQDREGSEGISHSIMLDAYALPGQLLAGTDSHTPHSGALGCLAFGVGATDMANAMLTGVVRVTVPSVIRIELNGRMPPGVTAKDLVLHLLSVRQLKGSDAVGAVFEFGGEALRSMSTEERATLTNMTAELGGFAGLIEPDLETVRFLRDRRGIHFELQPWMKSDSGATYQQVLSVDVSALSPIVAAPGDPGNGIALSDLAQRERIDIAFAGTCTGGKRSDFDMYHQVLAWARDQGLRVPEGVRLYMQFSSVAVRDYCVSRGYLATFEQVGAVVLEPSCGACANLGPGASERADQVTVSAQNRNFPGRSGPGRVWLASPLTVAASAIAGELMSFNELIAGRAVQARCP